MTKYSRTELSGTNVEQQRLTHHDDPIFGLEERLLELHRNADTSSSRIQDLIEILADDGIEISPFEIHCALSDLDRLGLLGYEPSSGVLSDATRCQR